MDRIVLSPLFLADANNRNDHFVTELRINGEPYDNCNFTEESVATDLGEYHRSLNADGSFFIITCWCGCPGCTGIEKGIEIKRDHRCVYWNDLDSREPLKYTFSLDGYRQAFKDYFRYLEVFLEKYADKRLRVVPDTNTKLIIEMLEKIRRPR